MAIELPNLSPRGYRTVNCCGRYATGEAAHRADYASCVLSLDANQRAAAIASYAELDRWVATIHTKADAERLLAELGCQSGESLWNMKLKLHITIYALWFPNRYIGLSAT